MRTCEAPEGCTRRAVVGKLCAKHMAAPPQDEIDQMVDAASKQSAADVLSEAVRRGYVTPTSEYAALRQQAAGATATTVTP